MLYAETMLVAEVLRYWYGTELPKAPRRLHGFILTTADAFSMPLLLKTLFAPWRRDVLPTTGLALQEKFRVIGYNLVAIFIGFFVRLFVLFIASFLVALTILLGTLLLGLWVILPFLPIGLFLIGIVLLFR